MALCSIVGPSALMLKIISKIENNFKKNQTVFLFSSKNFSNALRVFLVAHNLQVFKAN